MQPTSTLHPRTYGFAYLPTTYVTRLSYSRRVHDLSVIGFDSFWLLHGPGTPWENKKTTIPLPFPCYFYPVLSTHILLHHAYKYSRL